MDTHASIVADELKDIPDPHERRKAQNRIAQRRRRQRLRQDAEAFGADVAEMTASNDTNLNFLGSEQDFGLVGVPWRTLDSTHQELISNADSGFMDLVMPEAFELNDTPEVHGSTECSPQTLINPPTHNLPDSGMSDQCRHGNSQRESSPMTHPLNRYSGEPHQGAPKHSSGRTLDRYHHKPRYQTSRISSYNPRSRSCEPHPRPGMKTANSNHGSPSSPVNRRTRPEPRPHSYHHHAPPSIRPASSASSYRFSATSDAGSPTHDDWETQRSRITSTLTRRSKKLATDLTKLYELGVYLDIHAQDTELEDLLSRVKWKLAILDEQAESLNQFVAERTDDFIARQAGFSDHHNITNRALQRPDYPRNAGLVRMEYEA